MSKDGSEEEPPLDPRLGPWRARVFAATWLCYAGLYFCRKPFYVVKDELSEAYCWDAGFLGQLGAAYLVAYTLGQFISGIAGTRFGARVVLLIGMAGTVLSNLVFGLTDSAEAFLLFMVLNGLAQSTGWGNTVGVMGNWFRRQERGRVMDRAWLHSPSGWPDFVTASSLARSSLWGFLVSLPGPSATGPKTLA
jgi:sugar phosphate permease